MPDSKDPQDLNPEEQDNPEQEIKDFKILRIALAYLNREIADDSPSEENGLTALEQLILYEFEIEEDEHFNDTLEELKDDIIFEAQCLEEEDEATVELYILDEDQAIRRLAQATLIGNITDDVVSNWQGMTPLEQIIMYEWGYVEEEMVTNVKKRIKNEQLKLRGGRALRSKKEYEDYIPSSRF
jgi:hypothetical protein